MGLIENIKKDKMTAFRSGDKFKSLTLSTLLGEIDRLPNELVDGEKVVPDEKILSLIKSMVEKNKLTNSEHESLYLEVYLPKQLDGEELETSIKDIITNVNAKSMKDMGKVMGQLQKELGGQYDGKIASDIVKNLLK